MLNFWVWVHFPAILLAICVVSWWRGLSAERYGSMLILAANAFGDIALAASFPHFPDALMFAIDLALAFGLLFVAFRYSSLWLGGAMLLQSVALCLQAFDFAGEGTNSFIHVIANNGISYAMLGCLLAGLLASLCRTPNKAIGTVESALTT